MTDTPQPATQPASQSAGQHGLALLKSRASLFRDAHERPATPKSPVDFDSKIAQRIRAKNTYAADAVQSYSEVRRIIDLPVSPEMDPQEYEAFCRQHTLAPAYDEGFRLFPVQAQGLRDYQIYGGGFFPIAVGFGKTLLTLMIAHHAYTQGKKKIVLMVPPNVVEQLVMNQIPEARTLVPLSWPLFVLAGKSAAKRRSIARSARGGLYVLPYSLLSTRDSVETIKAISPDVLIGDEIHNVGRRSAARTQRLFNYINERSPDVIGLSGTITGKSVKDYWHIIKAALGDNCPLPLSSSMASEWASVLDSESKDFDGAGELSESKTGPLMPLVDWARRKFPDPQGELTASVAGFRAAYRLRLNSTPGVVTTGDAEIGTSLTLTNHNLKEDLKKATGYAKLEELIEGVEELWETPNGDEIEHAIHTYKWMYELSAGFYNELVWPTPEAYAERKGISEAEAEDILERAKLHHKAGQEYAHDLRIFLEASPPDNMDTPMLVGAEFARHPDDWAHHELFQLWRDHRDADFKGRPDRDSHAIRVCDYKIVAALEWAASLPKGKGGIVWYHHQEIGRWLRDYFEEAGLDPLYCPAGEAANKKIIETSHRDRIVLASISAHGTGKNLQHFSEQYCVQWPRSPKAAEQMLGRTHRNGQKADELIVHMNNTLDFDRLNFAACLNDALYIHQTTGNRQKLIYCNYDPVPAVFPYMVLQERGLQAKRLDAASQRILDSKFEQEKD